MSELHVIDHPMIQHKLTLMRKEETSSKDFRELLDEIAMFMAYEVTRDLPLMDVEIQTPICKTTQKMIAGKALVIVPILRAGIGILIHGAGDRGRGFASDALDVLCRYARQVLGLHQLWCSVAPDNAASLALFRRAGFVECGRKREWRRTPDGWADELLLQKIF